MQARQLMFLQKAKVLQDSTRGGIIIKEPAAAAAAPASVTSDEVKALLAKVAKVSPM